MATRIKITDEMVIEAVGKSYSYADVLRRLNIRYAGGSFSHYKRRVEKLGVDTTHFTGQGWKACSNNVDVTKKVADDILIVRTDGRRQKAQQLVRALIEVGVKHECSKCGQLPMWMGNPLTLDVDHINEDWLDDRKENLRFLCPNCHSQFSRNLI